MSKKTKRKIVVAGRSYLWWITDGLDPEFNSMSCVALTVASPCPNLASARGGFFVRFFLDQPPERRFLIVLGREFQGLPDAGGSSIRIRCPELQSQPSASRQSMFVT